MCTDPSYLDDGTAISCRKCWQCLETQSSDWVGRCIAEKIMTAGPSYSVTLTYGRIDDDPDHIRAYVLTYSDVQKWLKRMRVEGYALRYLVVGEYGKKRRAHWHALVYFQGNAPDDIIENQRFDQRYWPHGYSFYEQIGLGSTQYVCKYIQKDASKLQYRIGMSKYPPLGHQWFMRYARRYAEQGLSPQNLYYGFPGVEDKNGKRKQFCMRNTTAENFMQEFLIQWEKIHGGKDWPYSELLHEYYEMQGEILEDEQIGKLSAREREFREALLERKSRVTKKSKPHANAETTRIFREGELQGQLSGCDPSLSPRAIRSEGQRSRLEGSVSLDPALRKTKLHGGFFEEHELDEAEAAAKNKGETK